MVRRRTALHQRIFVTGWSIEISILIAKVQNIRTFDIRVQPGDVVLHRQTRDADIGASVSWRNLHLHADLKTATKKILELKSATEDIGISRLLCPFVDFSEFALYEPLFI